MVRELIDDPARSRVADVELALHERARRAALCGNRPGGSREQWIQLALGIPPRPFAAGALFQDLLHESRRALRLPERDDLLDLLVAHKGALDPGRLAGVNGLVEHVAAAEQLLGSARVEDHAAVDLRAHGECDA